MALLLAAVLFGLSFLAGRTRRFLFLFSTFYIGEGMTTHSSPHQCSSKEPTYDTRISRREKQFSSPRFTIDAERGTGISTGLSCI